MIQPLHRRFTLSLPLSQSKGTGLPSPSMINDRYIRMHLKLFSRSAAEDQGSCLLNRQPRNYRTHVLINSRHVAAKRVRSPS